MSTILPLNTIHSLIIRKAMKGPQATTIIILRLIKIHHISYLAAILLSIIQLTKYKKCTPEVGVSKVTRTMNV